ncbi:MAG TPA: serine protease, partial [Baekduia sp.]|nr:serine protease [Baekduia sp.]
MSVRLVRLIPALLLVLLVAAPSAQAGFRIVGGSSTPITATPWQVGLLFAGTSNTYDAQFCGGTIRDATTIITAAHCVDGYTGAPELLDVLAGTATLGNGSGQRIHVAAVDIHPGYDSDTYVNDVALLTLAAPITIPTAAPLVPVTDAEAATIDTPSDMLLVSGWGSTVGYAPGATVPPNYPTALQSVSIPFVPDSTCDDSYGFYLQAPLMLCAGQAGKDSCQGDSGGPLAFNVGGGTVRLAGVVSFGAGCAQAAYPGVYTEAGAPTIRSYMLSQPPPPASEEDFP